MAALWSAVLSKLHEPSPYLPFLYVGIVVALSVVVGYFTLLKPSRDAEKPIQALLGILAETPMKLGKRLGISPRMNLMLVTRPWYLFGAKRIKVVWGVGMESFPDVRFSCKHDQGVAGHALKTQLPVLADCEISDRTNFRFPQRLLDQTKHVTAVWSWPIYETDSTGRQTGRVIGVLNLDATAPGAFAKLSSRPQQFERYLKKFCEVASMIV